MKPPSSNTNTQSKRHEWDLSLELSATKHTGSGANDQYNDQPWVYVIPILKTSNNTLYFPNIHSLIETFV